MRERLVVADTHADATRMRSGGLDERSLERCVAAAQNRELRALGEQLGQGCEREVEALLF